MKVGIITFHNTPNYGATLQCYALSSFIRSHGVDVEVVNYMPPHNLIQYFKTLYLGRRRSIGNIRRIQRFYEFVRHNIKTSGAPVFSRDGLRALSDRYDLAFTGSDEVWKVDHMRKLDGSFYLDFCNPAKTRIASYAASASTVTDLRRYAESVKPLLTRFDAIAVRDPSTAAMVEDLTGRVPVSVVDPTLIYDFDNENLPPLREKPYVALYSWLEPAAFAPVRDFAKRNGLEVVSVGCINPGSDANLIDIGPREWMQLFKNSSVVVTDFFHGIVFSMIFRRPFYAHVDEKKRMKLANMLALAGLDGFLHEDTSSLSGKDLSSLTPDWSHVATHLAPHILRSRQYVEEQIDRARQVASG